MSIWDEETVQEVLGTGFTFFEASADASACSFTAIPASMTLAFRAGGQGELDSSRSGAALTGDVTDVDACDGGFVVDVQRAITIVEILDETSGRILQATASGVEMPLEASLELLTQACGAPTAG